MYRSAVASSSKDSITGKYQTIITEFTWDKDGNRIEENSIIRPYLYYECNNANKSDGKSMFGHNLVKLEFDTTYKRKEWISAHPNIPLYECQNPVKQYLLDKYYGLERSDDFTKFKFRIFFMDIEIEIKDVFPEPEHADYPINIISLYDSLENNLHVWIYNKEISKYFSDSRQAEIIAEVEKYHKGHNTVFHMFDSETKMMKDFISWWRDNFPDIITGWNVDKFDMIYIINRIKNILPKEYENNLSPMNRRVKTPVYAIMEKPQKGVSNNNPKPIYRIKGCNICDYINLYKKFEGTSRQSFKLDYIANLELGVGKFDYYDIGYETMREFMEKDFETFVQYNMIDTILVKMMDDKLKLIPLMRMVCNIGLVEYESIFQSIPYILGGLVIQARKFGMKLLTDSNRSDDSHVSEGFEGAFVYPTIPNFYRNGIVSLDFNSLYPNTIITLNISSDTKVGKILTDDPYTAEEIDIRKPNGKLTTISQEQFKTLLDKKCTISPNKILFMKPNIKRGIVPQFLADLYDTRVKMKKQMKSYIKEADKTQEEIAKLNEELKRL